MVPTWSLAHALTAPGNDSASARIAEWGRDHHASWLVNWLERTTYTPPKVGGSPAARSPLRAVRAQPVTPHAVVGLPPAVTPLASPPLPGEGRWQALDSVAGRAAMAVTYLRPDAIHTSYTSALVWINPRLVRAVFHPGAVQPGGGPWPEPPRLVGSERAGLIAAFNSAFRMKDARGGFYGFGQTLKPLRAGAASLVIDRDGSMTVGAWGRDVGMTSTVQVVRQNLDLIVDGGAPVAGLADNSGGRWGYTLGNAKYVWRSGIGVTQTGAVVVAIGNRLSASSLAELLARAGAIRAMELDINPYWTRFILYRSATGSTIERNLLPDMQRSPARYDTTSTRDFVALYLR